MIYVCTACNPLRGCVLTRYMGGGILPFYCTPDETGKIRTCHWRQIPIRTGPEHKSDLYTDPQGEPYKGFDPSN
jgi:hypothetical protein